MNNPGFAYLFEAKGIHPYLTDTGRLVDLVGASDLVASLCTSSRDDMLGDVIAVIGANVTESRRAGAAFCLHSPESDKLRRIQALWRLTVGLSCPGLSFADTDPADTDPMEGKDEAEALRSAYAAQPGLRENTGAFLLPVGHPVSEFNRRTGRVAVTVEPKGDDPGWLDAVVDAQRRRGRSIAAEQSQDRLARLFLPEDDDAAKVFRFPRQFDPEEADLNNPAFPFVGADRRIAMVHADVSGLGQTFRIITNAATAADQVMDVATLIEAAIIRAARQASVDFILPHAAEIGETERERRNFARLFNKVNQDDLPADIKIVKIVPARPILLGGDDITILVRADLAMGFVNSLLAGIERESRSAFAEIRKKFSSETAASLPEYLSACAGVAIVSAGHPFLSANRMAEGLCKSAKKVVKSATQGGASGPPASGVSFAVITSTIDEDYEDYRKREQILAQSLYGSACPYVVGQESGGTMQSIFDLAKELANTEGRNKLIEAFALRATDQNEALRRYVRFWKVLRSDDKTAADDKTAYERLRGLLLPFVGTAITEICDEATPDEKDEKKKIELDRALPVLNDAIELVDIGAVAARRAGGADDRISY